MVNKIPLFDTAIAILEQLAKEPIDDMAEDPLETSVYVRSVDLKESGVMMPTGDGADSIESLIAVASNACMANIGEEERKALRQEDLRCGLHPDHDLFMIQAKSPRVITYLDCQESAGFLKEIKGVIFGGRLGKEWQKQEGISTPGADNPGNFYSKGLRVTPPNMLEDLLGVINMYHDASIFNVPPKEDGATLMICDLAELQQLRAAENITERGKGYSGGSSRSR